MSEIRLITTVAIGLIAFACGGAQPPPETADEGSGYDDPTPEADDDVETDAPLASDADLEKAQRVADEATLAETAALDAVEAAEQKLTAAQQKLAQIEFLIAAKKENS